MVHWAIMRRAPYTLLVDYFDCEDRLLNDAGHLQHLLDTWQGNAPSPLAGSGGHVYQPQGISRLLVTGNARLLLHTWPEYGRASLDVLTWAAEPEARAFGDFVGREMGARQIQMRAYERHPD